MSDASQTIAPLSLSRRSDWSQQQAIGYLMKQAVDNPDVISLAAGLVDAASLPVQPARLALEHVLQNEASGRRALQYGTTAGSAELRGRLAGHLANLEGKSVDELDLDPDQLIVTTGSQQLLDLLADALFDPGDICLVAMPTYFVFLGVLHGVGARIIPVDTDENGMCPEALEAKLEALADVGELGRVKLIYAVSYFENPSGISISADRRPRFVDIARRFSREHRLLILEDAAYRELCYDGPTLPSIWSFDDTREHVILTQTFSKSFSPGVRVGFGVLPHDLVSPVTNRKANQDFGSANLNQELLNQVFASQQYDGHVESVRAAYRIKRDAMLAAADEFFSDIRGVDWVRAHGGLYVWMTLPKSIETGFESPLFHEATKTHAVMYVPGELCYPPDMPDRPKNKMRLSFGVQPPEMLREGMRRLAAAVRSQIA